MQQFHVADLHVLRLTGFAQPIRMRPRVHLAVADASHRLPLGLPAICVIHVLPCDCPHVFREAHVAPFNHVEQVRLPLPHHCLPSEERAGRVATTPRDPPNPVARFYDNSSRVSFNQRKNADNFFAGTPSGNSNSAIATSSSVNVRSITALPGADVFVRVVV